MNAPVTNTLMGLGAFPATHENFIGMLGMHGTYEANMAMHEADLILLWVQDSMTELQTILKNTH